MKKIMLLPLALSLMVSMAGCTAIDQSLEKSIMARAKIMEDTQYQQYVSLKDKGELDEEGVFIDEEFLEEEEEVPAGSVHVTFADNRYLGITYYLDEKLTEEINPSACYLNPGDRIYAAVESKNSFSNLYGIDSYRIYDYSTDGKRREVTVNKADSSLVYEIPASFSGSELSVVPVGQYPEREVAMRAYYLDEDGKEKQLSNSGTWYINNKKCKKNRTKISSVESYILRYEYEQDTFFFVSSSPECFTRHPESAGFLEFLKADPTDADVEYSVELHPYINLTVGLSKKGTVSLNGDKAKSVDKTWSSKTLKYGDEIVIETSGDCILKAGDYQYVSASKDPIRDGNRYTITISPEGSDDGAIAIDHYVTITLNTLGDYGDVTYKLDGKEVFGTITMQESQKLEATYKITTSGFTFNNSSLWNKGQGIFGNATKTITIDVTADMDGTTINGDDYFVIVSK